MLITLNSKTADLFCLDAGSFSSTEYNDVTTVCRKIVDDIDPQKYFRKFIFVNFTLSYAYLMIVQKYSNNNYASYITFGYNSNAIIYENKKGGQWPQ